MDEITARREAPGPPAFTSSPFPDFDHMLSAFGDGQFSFNLNLDQQKGSSSSRSRHVGPSRRKLYRPERVRAALVAIPLVLAAVTLFAGLYAWAAAWMA